MKYTLHRALPTNPREPVAYVGIENARAHAVKLFRHKTVKKVFILDENKVLAGSVWREYDSPKRDWVYWYHDYKKRITRAIHPDGKPYPYR